MSSFGYRLTVFSCAPSLCNYRLHVGQEDLTKDINRYLFRKELSDDFLLSKPGRNSFKKRTYKRPHAPLIVGEPEGSQLRCNTAVWLGGAQFSARCVFLPPAPSHPSRCCFWLLHRLLAAVQPTSSSQGELT